MKHRLERSDLVEPRLSLLARWACLRPRSTLLLALAAGICQFFASPSHSPVLAADLVLDFETPMQLELVDQKFQPAGSAQVTKLAPAVGAQCLEIKIAADKPGAQLVPGGRRDLRGVRYVDFWLKAPVGTEVRMEFLHAPPRGIRYPARGEIEVLTADWRRYHFAVDDFAAHTKTREPPDLSPPSAFRLLVHPPPVGMLGLTAEQARTLYLDDLRLTAESRLIAEQRESGAVTIRVDAGNTIGKMARPWEGVINYTDETAEVIRSELGMKYARIGPISINDWRVNSVLFQGVGQYDFSRVDSKNRWLKRLNAYTYNWIPAIPPFLWAGSDASEMNPRAEVDRPKGAFRPPSSWSSWMRVVSDFARYQKNKGPNVLGYAIGNETGSPAFWAGTDDEAREFYVRTAQAIKQGAPEAKVLGPSDAEFSVRRLVKFLDYCAERDAPLDYLTWHHYMHGRDARTMMEQGQVARQLLERYPQYRTTRLLNTEWGYALARQFEKRNQSSLAAAAVAAGLKAMVDGGIDMALFFMAVAAQGEPYWGSGLFEAGGTARPLLYTFAQFNKLGPTRLGGSVDPPETGIDAIAAVDEAGIIRVIAWWSVTGAGDESGSRKVSLKVGGARPGQYRVERVVIDKDHGNLVKGRGYVPLSPVGDQTATGPEVSVDFELPIYAVTMVSLTPSR